MRPSAKSRAILTCWVEKLHISHSCPWERSQFHTNFGFSDMLLIITSTGVEFLRNVNIDDLEWPWTPKIVGFSEFFAISSCDTHFKSELRQNDWRQTKTTYVWNFLRSKSELSTFKEGCTSGYQRSGYLSVVGLFSVEIVADMHKHATYHNKH